ncbi:Cof-type HAD-IIB family hydrolase [Brachybacterium sp. JHP9]|uniref:Cof-type HAD-IIB family hydrolase n=1 Tax=Brachybacterium equifaecis TaxID=2910770 RepID=A0ABT0QY87_9MICO|nr:HAD family hydrolase [Brachybacterium equifaecis]MCL6422626.1 Cof-type HAD-IIB family hydrolase [Brachybacterium equifaecis]
MQRVRLVASDLDGTLLDDQGVVTERTARAWRALWDHGIETVLVTARPPRWVDHLAGITGAHGVVICANGAFVYDAANQRMRERTVLAPELLRALIRDLRGIEGVALAVETESGFLQEDGFWATLAGTPDIGRGRVVADLTAEELAGEGASVGKLLARSDALGQSEFLERVREIVGDRALLSSSGADGLAEIGPVGVTKAAALARWCESLGITREEVWAFGDMPNDIPMLTWAGTGWAVAGAHEDVLAIADRTCPANTEDGVAQALEALLSGGQAAASPEPAPS